MNQELYKYNQEYEKINQNFFEKVGSRRKSSSFTTEMILIMSSFFVCFIIVIMIIVAGLSGLTEEALAETAPQVEPTLSDPGSSNTILYQLNKDGSLVVTTDLESSIKQVEVDSSYYAEQSPDQGIAAEVIIPKKAATPQIYVAPAETNTPVITTNNAPTPAPILTPAPSLNTNNNNNIAVAKPMTTSTQYIYSKQTEPSLGAYSVQILSLVKYEAAVQELKTISKSIKSAYVVSANINGIIYYRLRAFPSPNHEEAARYVKEINNMGYQSYVTRTGQ